MPTIGKQAMSPAFGVRVPVLAHSVADPDKGTGIAMICTFGDTNDVMWWREFKLPTRTIIGRNGRILPLDFATLPCDDASEAQPNTTVLSDSRCTAPARAWSRCSATPGS